MSVLEISTLFLFCRVDKTQKISNFHFPSIGRGKVGIFKNLHLLRCLTWATNTLEHAKEREREKTCQQTYANSSSFMAGPWPSALSWKKINKIVTHLGNVFRYGIKHKMKVPFCKRSVPLRQFCLRDLTVNSLQGC